MLEIIIKSHQWVACELKHKSLSGNESQATIVESIINTHTKSAFMEVMLEDISKVFVGV